MHNPIPEPDLHREFEHPKFDEILEFFKPAFSGTITARAIIDGNSNGSDIKWNNLSGKFRLAIIRNGIEIASLVGCQVDCFTGNCGVKAIDHLFFFRHPVVANTKEKYEELLSIVESFLYHKTNCGYLIGSDSLGYKGSTLSYIEQYGKGYEITKPTWNPNYTWSKDHTIALFHKDLNAVKHVPYWGESNDRG